MAIYEFFCPTCREKFEERRPMSSATTAATCKAGHKAERTLSMFAVSRSGGGTALMDEMPGSAAGGCCGGGGGCACAN